VAKLNKEPPNELITVHVSYPDARLVSKVESRICNHGELMARLYLSAPDKNGVYRDRSAVYAVVTHDPRALRITLKQLQNQGLHLISF